MAGLGISAGAEGKEEGGSDGGGGGCRLRVKALSLEDPGGLCGGGGRGIEVLAGMSSGRRYWRESVAKHSVRVGLTYRTWWVV